MFLANNHNVRLYSRQASCLDGQLLERLEKKLRRIFTAKRGWPSSYFACGSSLHRVSKKHLNTIKNLMNKPLAHIFLFKLSHVLFLFINLLFAEC